MSVAKCLGVDDLDAPNGQGVRAEWPRWQDAEPALNVAADIAALPRWMKQATPIGRDAVLAALGRVARSDRRAYVALAWLLVPGASRVAGRLGRLSEVIDEVVTGQLWIQICGHDPADDTYVAATILRGAERESLAELGLGELAERRGPSGQARSSSSGTTRPFRPRNWTPKSPGYSSSSSCDGRSTRERYPTRTATCCWIWLSRRISRVRRCGEDGRG